MMPNASSSMEKVGQEPKSGAANNMVNRYVLSVCRWPNGRLIGVQRSYGHAGQESTDLQGEREEDCGRVEREEVENGERVGGGGDPKRELNGR